MSATVTLEWPIELPDGTEVMYDIELEVTAPTPTVIRMDPDDSYEGDPGEVEIQSIKLQGIGGKGPGIEIHYRLWAMLGFTQKEIERIEEKAIEKASEDDRDYQEKDED